MQRILILGASGTVGRAVFRQLARNQDLQVFGTYCSSEQAASPSMLRFSVESPDDICALLEQVRPDVVISALRGGFAEQLTAHERAARYLADSGGKLIYLSTANVFDGSLQQPHYEADPPCSDSDYGTFKIQCEELLRRLLGSRAVLLRLPFVWGRSSPRIREVKAGCAAGKLEVYGGLSSNHVSDQQIAQVIEWIIREDKGGTFHVGTTDVVDYSWFITQLIAAMDTRQPELVIQEVPAVMAVLSARQDLPEALQWTSRKLIAYLCG